MLFRSKVVEDIIYEPLSFGDYIMSRAELFRRSTNSLFLDWIDSKLEEGDDEIDSEKGSDE